MSTQETVKILSENGLISAEKATQLTDYEENKLFSIHSELRAILYLGIVFFTTGLGTVIYKNIDTIGHTVLIILTAIITAICFFYVYQKRQTFSWNEVTNPSKFSDYILLLGCTMFLIWEGYLQFQYSFFGTNYGLATLIPAILFIFCAYRFDHKGVLTMGITAWASWLGLSISPTSLLQKNDFSDPKLLITAIIFGILMLIFSWFSEKQNIKKHFSYTYLFWGGNLASIAALTTIFIHDYKIFSFLIISILCYYFIDYARKNQSFIFLLMGVIYGYIAISYALFKLMNNDLIVVFGFYYFTLSSVGVVIFLLNVKKILRIKNEKSL